MSPFSAIAVTRLAGSAAVGAGRVAADAVETFADVFQEVTQGITGSADAAGPSGAAAENHVEELAGSIARRLRELLAAASLPATSPLTLELSPLGDIYIADDIPQRGAVEATLNDDAQLREALGSWSALTGGRSFRFESERVEDSVREVPGR